MDQTYFQDDWLSHPDYKNWVRKDADRKKAFCSLCHKSLELSNMGTQALKSLSATDFAQFPTVSAVFPQPAGIQGFPVGPTGPAGPVGPAGPMGLLNIFYVQS